MDQETAALLDKDRIVEVINRLFIGTDNRDWENVRRCFAPSVLFDMSSVGGGPARQTPREDIVAAWDTGLKPIQAIHHQAGNFIVDVRGDEAEAFCYGIAIHYLPNRTRANTRTFVGSYDFELQRQAGTWAIAEFRFTLKFLDGNPDLESS